MRHESAKDPVGPETDARLDEIQSLLLAHTTSRPRRPGFTPSSDTLAQISGQGMSSKPASGSESISQHGLQPSSPIWHGQNNKRHDLPIVYHIALPELVRQTNKRDDLTHSVRARCRACRIVRFHLPLWLSRLPPPAAFSFYISSHVFCIFLSSDQRLAWLKPTH